MTNPNLDDYRKVGQHWPIYLHRTEVEAAVEAGGVVRFYPADTPQQFMGADAVAVSPARLRQQDATSTGIRLLGGNVDLEHNQDLQPEEWRGSQYAIGIVDKMVREDPVAQAIRLAVTLPIESAVWTFEPADDSDEAWAHAELVRTAFARLPGGLSGWIQQADDFAWRGFALFEPVFTHDKAFRLEVGGKAYLDGATTLRKIVTILPWSVRRWEEYPEGYGVELWPRSGDQPIGSSWSPDYTGARLAPEEMLHIRYQPEGENPEPVGLLRPCYAGWQMRRTYARLELTGFQRSAYGIPYVEADAAAGARPGDVDKVNQLLSNLRAGLRANFMLPKGYTLHFADFPFKAAEIREARIAAGRDMARAAWAQMAYTGEDNGTQALIGGQQSFFTMLLDGIARDITASADVLIRQLVSMNFGPLVRAFPRMVHGAWKMSDPAKLVEATSSAATAGLLTASADVERTMRDALGLPPMPEHVELAWEAKAGSPDPDDDVPPVPPVPSGDGGSEADSDVTTDDAADGEKIAKVAAAEALGALDRFWDRRAGDTLTAGPNGRTLMPIERCVRLSETDGRKSAAKDELAAIVSEWRARVAEPYASKVAAAPDLVAAQKVTVPDVGALTRELASVLGRVYSAGRESIVAELERQERDPALRAEIEAGLVEVGRGGDVAAPATLADHAHGSGCGCGSRLRLAALVASAGAVELAPKRLVKPRPAPGLPDDDVDEISPAKAVQAVAATTANIAARRLVDAAISALQSSGRGGAMPDEDAGAVAVVEAVGSLSTGPDKQTAQGDANTIFGLGRDQEGRAQGVDFWVYSNLLESNVCDECKQRDGIVFPTSDLDAFATPAVWCLGGDSCNCLCIAVLSA